MYLQYSHKNNHKNNHNHDHNVNNYNYNYNYNNNNNNNNNNKRLLMWCPLKGSSLVSNYYIMDLNQESKLILYVHKHNKTATDLL